MSPEERQLLQGVFDRMRDNANGYRDPDADRLIADNVRQQPYSSYYLTQAVIVQEQALQAANQRIQQLEQQTRQGGQPGGGSFLSGLFRGGSSRSQDPVPMQRPSVWNQGGTQGGPPPGGGYQQNYSQGGYQQGYAPPPPQGGPWGQQAGQQQAPQGGGFLRGALTTAAGVAGGALLFDGIKGLMGGHGSELGIGAGVPGVNETVVNNYYDNSGGDQTAADYQQDMAQDSADNSASASDWQQDADQDQDDAQDASDV